jgi:hypothetical protein
MKEIRRRKKYEREERLITPTCAEALLRSYK